MSACTVASRFCTQSFHPLAGSPLVDHATQSCDFQIPQSRPGLLSAQGDEAWRGRVHGY